MKEIWKDIKGYDGDYQVSNLGRVKSIERKVVQGRGFYIRPELIMNIQNKKYDQPRIRLYKDTKATQYLIKNIVAETFNISIPVEYKKEFYEVVNIDGDINNCSVKNLRYEIKESAIRVFDFEGYMISDFPSPKYIVEELGLDEHLIANCLSNPSRGFHTNGFQMRRLKRLEIKKLPSLYGEKRGDTRPCAKFYKGKVIAVYNSITEAAEKCLIENPITIAWAIDRNTTINGMNFKYIE